MKPERTTKYELDRDIVAAYARTFIPRFDCYPIQLPDGSYCSVKKMLSLTLVDAHLKGNITLGAYALNPDHQAQWLCFDADDEPERQGLHHLHQHLANEGLPSYLEQSRRGGHLWLFTDPLAGKDARRFGKWLLAENHLETIELYPKQAELRVGAGSLVRLPLGIHRKADPPKRYHFVTADSEPLAPTIRQQIAMLCNPGRIPKKYVEQVLSHLPEPKQVFPTPRFKKRGKIVGETPAERIKNAISVPEFVSEFVQLDRGGRGLCPFHDDHRESFSVDQERNYWQCFACKTGYTVIDFWMRWRNIGFKEAISELANEYLPPLP